MKAVVKDAYVDAEQFYRDLYNRLATIAEVTRKETDIEQLADTAFAIREIGALMKAMNSRCNAIQELAEKLCCMLMVQNMDVDKIKTEYCSAEPDLKQVFSVPRLKDDPEGYRRMMEWLGVPEEVWNIDTNEQKDRIRVHWPGLVEHVTEKLAAGEQLPEGIDASTMRTVFRLNIRKRKGVSAKD